MTGQADPDVLGVFMASSGVTHESHCWPYEATVSEGLPNITQAESLPKSPQLWSPHTIHPPNFIIFLSPSSQPDLPLIFLSKVHWIKHFTKTPWPRLRRQFAFSRQMHTVKLHRTLSQLHPPLNPSCTEHLIGHASRNTSPESLLEVTVEVEFWLFSHSRVPIFMNMGLQWKSGTRFLPSSISSHR